MRSRLTTLFLVLAVTSSAALAGSIGGVNYTVVTRDAVWMATDLSETGYIVGADFVGTTGADRAVIWDPNGVKTSYASPSTNDKGINYPPFGQGVSDAGELVGYNGYGNLPLYYTAAGAATGLPDPPDPVNGGDTYGLRARDISADGSVIVGITEGPSNWAAAVWTKNGGSWTGQVLPNNTDGSVTGGFFFAHADKVNANGVIAGTSFTDVDDGQGGTVAEHVPALWTDSGSGYQLEVLPAPVDGNGYATFTVAAGLNDLAVPTVVGASSHDDNAYVWTNPGSGYVAQAVAPAGVVAGDEVVLTDVNDDNLAVGYVMNAGYDIDRHYVTEQNSGAAYAAGQKSYLGAYTASAWAYDIDTDTWLDLNSIFAADLPSGWTLSTAIAINNEGDILCNARDAAGDNYALLLDAPGGPVLIPGDCDGDGDVDLTDLAILASNYGAEEPPALEHADGDFDDDGDVDLTDLAILANNYGFGTMTAVPEPASAAVLLAGGAFAWRKRRQS